MSFFTANSFIFNGLNSANFGVIPVWFEEDIDASTNGLNQTIIKSESINNKIKNDIYGTERSEPISFSFGIAKPDGKEFTREESIKINQWLSTSLPQLLKFNDEESYALHYYAICVEINDKIIGGKLVGKELVFETNSSYAFQNKLIKTIKVQDEATFSLINTSDTYNGVYYPRLTINAISDVIVIENITDKKSLTLNTEKYKTIVLDCENMIITDNNNNLIYINDIGWSQEYESYVSSTDSYIDYIYWIRLLQGSNQFKITGSCTIVIECEFPRKAGCC